MSILSPPEAGIVNPWNVACGKPILKENDVARFENTMPHRIPNSVTASSVLVPNKVAHHRVVVELPQFRSWLYYFAQHTKSA